MRSRADAAIAAVGYYEVALVNHQQKITEGSRSNLFFIDGAGTVLTAPLGDVLGGITRQVILEELQRLNAQGWSYRRLAEKYGVSSSAIGRRAVLEGWHGTNDQRANARLRNLAARLRRQAEQRLAEDLDTREIKELTAVLRELMNLQQTLEGQQPGGGVVRVELAEETEDWSL